MNTQTNNGALQKYWGWVLTLGILLVVLGCVAVGTPFLATITSIVVFGWLLIFSGFSQFFFTFSYRESDNFFMYVLISILTMLIGIFIVANPEATAITATLLLAAFFLAVGIFRVYSALVLRFRNWGWMLVGGLISVVLGILILLHWPSSALWIIGLFIGIELLFTGWSFILAALVLKNARAP